MTHPNKKQKVLFICSAKITYTRNDYLISTFKNNYNTDLIYSNKKSYLLRIPSILWQYLVLRNKQKYDFVFIGFLAQPLIPFIRFFYKKTIIADFFIFLQQTICLDRKFCKENSILGRLIYNYEKFTSRLVDGILVDTKESKKFLINTYAFKNINLINPTYVLANEKIFKSSADPQDNNELNIFYYAITQRIHGVDIIIKAINNLDDKDSLKNKEVSFTFVGPLSDSYKKLFKEHYNNIKVTHLEWVEYIKLPNYIERSSIVLGGHFSATQKAKKVIPGKVFQFAVMKKAIILGDNNANRELFEDKKNCLFVEMNNPVDLSNKIEQLIIDKELRVKISSNAYQLISEIKKENNLNLINFINELPRRSK